MAIKDLPKYKDIRGTIRRNGRYPKVGTACKDTHVIHHSMTAMHLKGSNPNSFANTHIDIKKWQGIAYAFVIMPDGTIYQCDDLDRRTNHAGNTNTRSIGTCLVGDFRKEGANEQPTEEQKLSLYLLNKELYKELPNMKQTIGHQECPGYSWKNCPGNTWNYKSVIAGVGITLNSPEGIGIAISKYPDGYGVNYYDAPNGSYRGRLTKKVPYTVYQIKNGHIDIGQGRWIPEASMDVTRFTATSKFKEGYGVNYYNAPNGTYKGKITKKIPYKVYNRQDGWVDIGQNKWIPEENMIIK